MVEISERCSKKNIKRPYDMFNRDNRSSNDILIVPDRIGGDGRATMSDSGVFEVRLWFGV